MSVVTNADPRALGRVIRDPIHDYIHLPLELNALIDEPMMQRLRRIAQTGLADQVYPGLSGNRLQHSLGVMHLAMEAWRHAWNNCASIEAYVDCILDYAERENPSILPENRRTSDRVAFVLKQTTLAAGILGATHDIGHPPLAHAAEEFLSRHPDLFSDRSGSRDAWAKVMGNAEIRTTHEVAGLMIRQSIFARQVAEAPHNLDTKGNELAWWLAGVADSGIAHANWASPLRELVAGPFDVDRLDYMLRDSWLAGIETKAIDKVRLLQSFEIHQTESGWTIGVGLRGRSAVESLLTQRFEYQRWVYHHPHVASVHGMVDELLEQVLSASTTFVPGRSMRPTFQYVSGSTGNSLHDYRGGGSDVDDVRLIEWIRQTAIAIRAEKRLEPATSRTIDALADAVLARRSNWLSMWRDEIDYRGTALRTRGGILAALRKRIGEYEAEEGYAGRDKGHVRAWVLKLQHVVDAYQLGGDVHGLNSLARLLLEGDFAGERLNKRRSVADKLRALCRFGSDELADGIWVVSLDRVRPLGSDVLHLYDGEIPMPLTEIAPHLENLDVRAKDTIQFYCAYVVLGDVAIREGRHSPYSSQLRPAFESRFPDVVEAMI